PPSNAFPFAFDEIDENPPPKTYTGGRDKILEIDWEMKIDELSTATLICSELGRLENKSKRLEDKQGS
ncbi:hypothetical protein U1Q18_026023, partial [Sarracenia purpurea var. burkii]